MRDLHGDGKRYKRAAKDPSSTASLGTSLSGCCMKNKMQTGLDVEQRPIIILISIE
jgi:hypothetical protein